MRSHERLVGELRDEAIRRSHSYDDECFVLRGLWSVDLFFRPTPQEREFDYRFLLAQTEGQGCCYCPHGSTELVDGSKLGKDARDIRPDSVCLEIALLDAIYSSFPRRPSAVHHLDGFSGAKSLRRAEIVCAEAVNLATGRVPSHTKIVNVGVVGTIVKLLGDAGYIVCCSDLDEDLQGSVVHGVEVQGGDHTCELVRDADVAVVTGMTLATGTLEGILEASSEGGCKVLLFAETGANMAEAYMELGIDVVVGEQFPFYIFQGRSVIEVFR